MTFIYKDIIKDYIKKLSVKDVKSFLNLYKLEYNEDEAIIIYNFIMYNYNDLLNENIKVFESIRNLLNPNLYKELLKLYIEYKNKFL